MKGISAIFFPFLVSIVFMQALSCKTDGKQPAGGSRFSGGTGAPVRVGIESDWEDVSAGFQHTCGIRKGGSLWCWGRNSEGQAGNGAFENVYAPAEIGEGVAWDGAGLGDYWTCGVAKDNSLWCWGSHVNGSAREDKKTANAVPERLALKSGNLSEIKFLDIAPGDGHVCGLAVGGKIYCWGAPRRLGRSGEEYGKEPAEIDASNVNAPKEFTDLSVGSGHSCGLTGDGRAFCWGRNDFGQTGTGTFSENVDIPTAVLIEDIAGSKIFSRIAAGTFHACAIMDDGAAYCWGKNGNGQLGCGDTSDRAKPVKVAAGGLKGSKEFIVVSAGFSHTCGITKDNLALCWGEVFTGKTCNGYKDPNCLAPITIKIEGAKGESGFRFVSAGTSHSCLIAVGGALYCWGNNEDGRLGTGL